MKQALAIALSACLGLGATAAHANDAAPPCSLCTWPLGWNGHLDIGPGWVSDDDPRFGDYTGLDEAGPWLSLDGQARHLDGDGRHFGLWWREPLLDARQLAVRAGHHGRWRAQLQWREIPHLTGIGARTPFTGAGSGDLRLPADWVRAPTTSAMAALAASLRPVDLEVRRRQLDFQFDARNTSRWRWQADAGRTRREGTRAFGAGALTLDTSHLPAPVDHTTDRVGLGVEYQGTNGALRAQLSGSWFDNGAGSLTWDNPFTSLVGAQRLRAALEPDNQAWSAQLGGAWKPTPRLRLAGRAGIGAATQDEAFLPYSTLAEFEDQPLPRASLDGRIEATSLNAAGNLDFELGRGWDLDARIRLDDRDNRTPVTAWTPVITDFYARDPTLNRPYGFRRDELGAQARYSAASGWRFSAGAFHRTIERSLQSVAQTTEDGLALEFGSRPAAAFGLRLALEASDRDASRYTPFADPGLPGNPLMRKFNLADRARTQARLELDGALTDALAWNLAARWSNDEYRHSPLGLQSAEEAGIELGLDAALGEHAGVHAFAGAERIEALVASQQDFTQDWRSHTEDGFYSWGLGGHARLGGHWRARLDAWGARSRGEIDTAGAPFPVLRTDLRQLTLSLDYDDGSPWAWRLAAQHERYEAQDWQRDALAPDSLPAVLTLGLENPGGSVTVLRATGSYRF